MNQLICAACRTANPGRAKFCMECGTTLRRESFPEVANGTRVVAGDRRIVTVVFADLSGFTSYSEKTDIEKVRVLAHEAAQGLARIVEDFGGSVDKILGDAVMAIFGAPIAHEDDPERAVRAALGMQAFFKQNREKFRHLPLSIGINTGEVMFAPVGAEGQYTVIGDAVNTAARLQSAAARGEILVGGDTYSATVQAIEYQSVAPIKAKNKAERVSAWRAVSVTQATPVNFVTTAPMVGRTDELSRLRELWERVRTERRPHLAFLLGPPGIGKSRLIRELTSRVEGASSVFWGRCLSYGEGITYWPVIEAIKEAAGITYDEKAKVISTKLGSFLEGLGTQDLDELRTMAVAIANLVAAPVTPRGTYQATKISKAELHWGIRRVLQLSAAREPLVLVIEDLHWAEPTLLELIRYIIDGGEAPILFLGSARPELKEKAPDLVRPSAYGRVIELKSLSERESESLLSELAVAYEFTDSEIRSLIRAAGGNPLFLEELVQMVADPATSEGKREQVKLRGIPVPKSLRSLIGSRLDALPSSENRVLQRASVMGDVFWLGALGHLDEGTDEIEPGLAALAAKDLVHEQPATIGGEREFAFKHILIRDVAYDRLPKGERARLHERYAGWITKLARGTDEFAEIIAFHFEQACRLAWEAGRSAGTPPLLPAVQALTRAGEKAEGREGTREAKRYYERAIELVAGRLPETETELRLRHSRTLGALGDIKDAKEAFQLVAETSSSLGRDDLRGSALLSLAGIDLAQGNPRDARERLSEAGNLASQLGDRPLRTRAAFGMATLHDMFEGAAEQAIEVLENALTIAQECDERELQMEGYLRLGTTLINIGRLAKAAEHFASCAALARREGSLRFEAGATQFLGLINFYMGNLAEAERLTLQSLDWFARTADQYLYLQNLRALAKFALSRGDFNLAEQRLNEALPKAREVGGWLVVEVYRYLAEALAHQGRAADARRAADGARAALSEDDPYANAATMIAEGFAAGAEGNEAALRDLFMRAMPMIEQQSYSIDLGEVRIAFARALIEFGDTETARQQLHLARETFAPMGATGLLAEIDRELATTDARIQTAAGKTSV